MRKRTTVLNAETHRLKQRLMPMLSRGLAWYTANHARMRLTTVQGSAESAGSLCRAPMSPNLHINAQSNAHGKPEAINLDGIAPDTQGISRHLEFDG